MTKKWQFLNTSILLSASLSQFTPSNSHNFLSLSTDQLKSDTLADQFSKSYKEIDSSINLIEKNVKKMLKNLPQMIKTNNSLLEQTKDKVEALGELISEKTEHLLSLPRDTIIFKFNYQSLVKFNTLFSEEKELIVKPFIDAYNLTRELTRELETIKTTGDQMEYELSKLQIHVKTIQNFLIGAYNADNQEAKVPEWQVVKLSEEVYEYYEPILNKKSTDLIKGLHKLLNETMTPQFLDIDENYNNLWNVFKEPGFKDISRGKENTILDIYSKNFAGTDKFNYTEKNQTWGEVKKYGDGYNREHLIPKAYFEGKEPMYYDAHHIFPTDARVNQERGNFRFGIVKKPKKNVFPNGEKFGTDANGSRVFEPDDYFKGDIARSYMYFAIKYYNVAQNFDFTSIFETKHPFISGDNLTNFLNWHENFDLPDQYDMNRNVEIFNFQKNRNPFIDIPYLSKLIWNQAYKNIELTFEKV